MFPAVGPRVAVTKRVLVQAREHRPGGERQLGPEVGRVRVPGVEQRHQPGAGEGRRVERGEPPGPVHLALHDTANVLTSVGAALVRVKAPGMVRKLPESFSDAVNA
jgi:hypothetical protein